jgi:hypothetical protein
MGIFTATRNYADLSLLTEAQLDAAFDSIETFINTTKLSDSNIQDDGITASTKVAAATITSAKLAANSVGTLQLVADSVTAVKLASDVAGDGLTQAVDGSLEVAPDTTTVELDSNELQVVAGSITNAKRYNAYVVVKGTQINDYYSVTATSPTDLPSYDSSGGGPYASTSVTFAATGRPWMFWLQPTGSTASAAVYDYAGLVWTDTGTFEGTVLSLYEDSTRIAHWAFDYSDSSTVPQPAPLGSLAPCSLVRFIVTPTAGTHTYTLKMHTKVSGGIALVCGFGLWGMEL